jgi:hypothetical protein
VNKVRLWFVAREKNSEEAAGEEGSPPKTYKTKKAAEAAFFVKTWFAYLT